jgi:hypothetical protein
MARGGSFLSAILETSFVTGEVSKSPGERKNQLSLISQALTWAHFSAVFLVASGSASLRIGNHILIIGDSN